MVLLGLPRRIITRTWDAWDDRFFANSEPVVASYCTFWKTFVYITIGNDHFFGGKTRYLTIAIFNSKVKLPEGNVGNTLINLPVEDCE